MKVVMMDVLLPLLLDAAPDVLCSGELGRDKM